MQRLQAGFTLGDRYVLRRQVGVGGMGEVWAANDTVLARTVALKIMHPRTDDESAYAKRFREEAMHTAGLSHLNIATLFDYGEHDGLAYLVMELVRGVTLQQLLERDGAQSPSRVRSVIGQSALALSVAHEAGIVHRDVKPANIMVTKDGTVKLTDFGIARSADSSGLTRHGEMLGTPHYVSPEQAMGEVATPLSDLYALGIVAHELLSGRRPFDKGTPIATALAQVQEPPPPLPDGVPSDIREVIEACLAKDPAQRPQSALAVAEALGIPGIEAHWPGSHQVVPKRAAGAPQTVTTDLADVNPRRGIELPATEAMLLPATEAMQVPADWADPAPTSPPETEGPTTAEIDQGAFAGAAVVRDRLDDDADARADHAVMPEPTMDDDGSTRWWMPRAVVPDEPVGTADPWPEATTPTPAAPVPFDEVPPLPKPGPTATPSLVIDPGTGVTAARAGRAVPLGWVVVIVVVAVALALLVSRLL